MGTRKPVIQPKPPSPGSDEALDMGCKCPVLDNAHGRGNPLYGGDFVINSECAMHNPSWHKNARR